MLRFVSIDAQGQPNEPVGLPPVAWEACQQTSLFYSTVGFIPPWIGYLALNGEELVGTCGFKGPPVGGRVEIAYFTFPDFEGKGYATQLAKQLIALSRETDPKVVIFAQTLAEENASNHILKKLGFRFMGELQHPTDGKIWEFEL